MDVDSSCKAKLLCRGSTLNLLLIVTLCYTAAPCTALLLRKPAACRNATDIAFLAFYPPCSIEAHSSSELERLERCDLLTVAAIDLAVERINQSPSILPEGSTLRVIPIDDGLVDTKDSANVYIDDKMIMQVQALANVFCSEDSNKVWGVIGPSDPREAEFLAPIFHKEDLITISYGSESTTTDKVSSFYRTLPSIHGTNYARLHLMTKFRWHRVAILPDLDNKYFELEAEEFVSLINWILEYYGYTEYFDSIAMFTPLSDSQSSKVAALRQVQSANVSIMFGLFGPEKARQVLCMANSMDLVSENHAWILPSYYNPNWWKLPVSNDSTFDSSNGTYCSNEKMEEILESVVFIKNTKFPPLDLSLNDFHSQLMSKALDLFPSLTGEDLKPYLLRSRAINAYDAVTLLARSVGVAFEQHQGEESCPGTKEVQTALEKNMDCEYCRINDPDGSGSEKCHQACTATRQRQKKLRSDPIFNHYGQTLFSQFIGGHEHPINLLWTETTVRAENLHHFAIPELDHAPLAKKLNLSSKDFVINGSWHPMDFQWRGLSAPDSHFFKHMSIATMEVILIAVLVATGLLIAVVLLIFNVIWRNNKIVKASSPRLNVIFLIGIILTLPTALFESLAISSTAFDPHRNLLTAMCYFKFWMYYLGEAIFIATLLMKNWRIYRIFYNKRLRNIGNKLSDIKLMVVILLMLLPVATILIIWSAFDNIRMDFSHAVQDSENLQLITVSACCSNHLVVFQTMFIIYTSLTLLLLFVLTLLVANVQRIEFRREGLGSHRAVALAVLPLPALYIAWAILLVYFPVLRYHALLWIEFALTGVLPMLIMIVLFAPNVYFVVKEHMNSKQPKVQSARNKSPLRKRQSYHSFRRETIILKTQLSETNQMIAKLLAKRQQLEGLDTPNLKDTQPLKAKPPATISPDYMTHKKRHDLHLTFNDCRVSTQTSDHDASPQSTTTLFTCIGYSDYDAASQCNSLSEYHMNSLNEYSYLWRTNTDANNTSERLKRSVSDTDDRTQRGNDVQVNSEDVQNVEDLDCHASVDSLELRREQPPAIFVFDMKELTFEPSKWHEKNVMSRDNDSAIQHYE